jgi:hypothetical protein
MKQIDNAKILRNYLSWRYPSVKMLYFWKDSLLDALQNEFEFKLLKTFDSKGEGRLAFCINQFARFEQVLNLKHEIICDYVDFDELEVLLKNYNLESQLLQMLFNFDSTSNAESFGTDVLNLVDRILVQNISNLKIGSNPNLVTEEDANSFGESFHRDGRFNLSLPY